eukprot:gene12629-6533_t
MNLRICLLTLCLVVVYAKVGYFWQLSDPHIDYDYKEGGDMVNCNFEIVCCRHKYANTTKKAGKFSAPESSCNTPIVTIDSTFNFIKTFSQRLNPKPSFVLMTGDYVGHDNEFQSNAKNLHKINYFTELSEKMGSGMKIYPSFGNHDGFPVDQLKLPPSDYLNQLARIWSKHKLTQKSIEDIRKGGYYSETIVPGLRVINLNTQWTNNINFYLYINQTDDHANQMKWLEENLKNAEQKNEKVVILGHIRPGATSRWQDYKLVKFEKLVQEYHEIIIGQFYGHQHQDSLAFMMSKDDKIINSMYVGGVVVTKFNKHSTVRLFKYDADSFKLLDYEDFYIPLKESEQNGAIIWKRLYKFTEEYGVPDLSNESMEKLFSSFKTSNTQWNHAMHHAKNQICVK